MRGPITPTTTTPVTPASMTQIPPQTSFACVTGIQAPPQCSTTAPAALPPATITPITPGKTPTARVWYFPTHPHHLGVLLVCLVHRLPRRHLHMTSQQSPMHRQPSPWKRGGTQARHERCTNTHLLTYHPRICVKAQTSSRYTCSRRPAPGHIRQS